MDSSDRIETRQVVRRGERTIQVRVIAYERDEAFSSEPEGPMTKPNAK
jgi:hypothetical protein